MKLHWSPRSPFVRKVMICIHECRVAGIEFMRTPTDISTPNLQLLPDNPIGKIPALLLDDGSVLYDSPVICEFLAPGLFPSAASDKWTALRRQALGDGILDALLWWRYERNKPEALRIARLIAAFTTKMDACLDALEAESSRLHGDPFTIGHVSIGCALAYLDFRFADIDWRRGRHGLAAWFEAFSARPSVRRTAFVDDLQHAQQQP